MRICRVEGCQDAAANHRTVCRAHRKHSNLKRPYMTGTPAERVAAWAERAESGCLIFTGDLMTTGYGRITVNGRKVGAHRIAYEATYGPIPPGLEIDHLCRTRTCVEPSHLEAVTRAENLARQLDYLRRGDDGRWIPHGIAS